MAAPIQHDFDKWLSKKLLKINPDVDLEVFVTYITGILETEADSDDREESIGGLLAEITEDEVESHCTDVVKKWDEIFCHTKNDDTTKGNTTFEDHVHSIVEKQQTQTVASKTVSAEARARKQAILAQYAHVSDGEEEDDGSLPVANAATANGVHELTANMNAVGVNQREQETRERMKQEHVIKKQKDKDDQEKQKQKAIDRKEAEKKRTQKGEKRR